MSRSILLPLATALSVCALVAPAHAQQRTLTDEQKATLQERLKAADANGDGLIDRAEADAKLQREVAVRESRQKVKAETRIAELETEKDRERRYIESVADAFREQQAELEKLKLPDDEKLNLALAAVAGREKLSEEDYWAAVNRFVVAVRANPKADLRDRALADFAERKSFAAVVATIAAKLDPSGMMVVRGVPQLIYAKRPLPVGTRFTATYKNQDYEVELVAIDRTSFTLRYQGEEITRPIKRAK